MKNFIILLALTLLAFKTVGQSILTDSTKFQVKVLANGMGFQAVIPLECGDGETIKKTPIFIYLGKLEKSLNEKMLMVSTFEMLNVMSKLNCKNKLSWKPSKLSIFQINGKISANAEGSAENSYGSRGEVTFNYLWKNGEFVNF